MNLSLKYYPNYILTNFNWINSFCFVKWDDKITTLPGLYYLSTTVLRLVALALKEKNVMNICNVYNLRLSNIFLSTLNFIIIYKILVHFKTKKQSPNESVSVSWHYKWDHLMKKYSLNILFFSENLVSFQCNRTQLIPAQLLLSIFILHRHRIDPFYSFCILSVFEVKL